MRFDVSPVIRGHWKGLSDGRYNTYRPDWIARIALLLPIIASAAVWAIGGSLASPASLLAATALLAGGMLSSFTHLSSLRLKITEWNESDEDRFFIEREMLDETASHLLMGTLICVINSAAIVIGMNTGPSAAGSITGFWAALVSGLSVYILLVFILIIPRLYSAWVEINNVSPRLNGFHKGRH